MKTGILVVSFGTTHLDTLAETIVKVEEDIAAAFPGVPTYRAFTSGIVRRRLKKEFHLVVDGVPEALRRMEEDGIEHAVIQPTLLIPGEENDLLRRDAILNAGKMSISIGLPLLWDDKDLNAVLNVLQETYPMDEETVLLTMGHGTEHEANSLYIRLAELMEGRSGALALCTVEGEPSFEDALKKLSAQPKRKVHLLPLLLVAGDHSKNDMAGEEDSLRSLLEEAGFQVSWSLRGLGQIPAIRQMYVRRTEAAMKRGSH